MAYTFHKINRGVAIGSSLFDPEGAKIVADLEAKAKAKRRRTHLPRRLRLRQQVRPRFRHAAGHARRRHPRRMGRLRRRPQIHRALQEGHPRRQDHHLERPRGRVRIRHLRRRHEGHGRSRRGSHGLRRSITVVGGGDTATAAKKFGVDTTGLFHCSTGGGASLEYTSKASSSQASIALQTDASSPTPAANSEMRMVKCEMIPLLPH